MVEHNKARKYNKCIVTDSSAVVSKLFDLQTSDHDTICSPTLTH